MIDGLGRVKQTQLNSDPAGVVYADTTFDELGRKKTVSNPHRAAAAAGGAPLRRREPCGCPTPLPSKGGSASLSGIP